MKIGILTFHDTGNYGAALQTYASVEALKRMGHAAEIIDYTNPERKSMYEVGPRLKREIRNKSFVGALKTLCSARIISRKMGQFNAFYRQYTPRSPERIESASTLKEAASRYDAIIAGSDQIWNPRNNGGDTAYLLDFVEDPERTITYASSFGAVELPKEFHDAYAHWLKRIRAISVREEAGVKIVNELTGRDVPRVVDPVFLLTPGDWLQLATKDGIESPPSCGLLDYTATAGMLDKFLKTTGLNDHFSSITKIGTALRPRDLITPRIRIEASDGPLSFLRRLMGTELLFTSSFHGTALAILLRRPFITILSGDAGRDSRITNLLSDLGLSNRIYRSDMTTEDVMREIPFEEVHSIIKRRRQESLDFLSTSLSQILPR
jgi:hypothetical protein